MAGLFHEPTVFDNVTDRNEDRQEGFWPLNVINSRADEVIRPAAILSGLAAAVWTRYSEGIILIRYVPERLDQLLRRV